MSNENVAQFGYDLIRNDVLQDVLGSEHDHLLYWVGKSLARKQQLENVDDIIQFFTKANWGQLTQIKEKRSEQQYELTGDWMSKDDKRAYQLEAGFLAEIFEVLTNMSTAVTFIEKKNSILFTVHFDRNDHVTIKPSSVI